MHEALQLSISRQGKHSVTELKVVCVVVSVWVCDHVAVCENQRVCLSVGKHRSVQLRVKQIRMKRFNDIHAPVVGVAAQAACYDCRMSWCCLRSWTFSGRLYSCDFLSSVMQNGDVCTLRIASKRSSPLKIVRISSY